MAQGKRFFWGVAGILLLFGIDQWSKHLAVSALKGRPGISLIPGVFELQYLENHGAAFGMLQNQRGFLLGISFIILAALFIFYLRIPRERHYLPLRAACMLIGAGALGNMADRFLYGYVVDFFYFRLIDFPIFNIADCYVTVSCAIVLFCLLFVYREEDFSFLHRKPPAAGQEEEQETGEGAD